MLYLTNLYAENKPLFYAAAMVAVIVVVLLVVVAWRLLFGRGVRVPGAARSRQVRLGVVDVHDIDRERQLVLVRRDNVEHLIMIGGPNDLLIESQIVRVEARPPREAGASGLPAGQAVRAPQATPAAAVKAPAPMVEAPRVAVPAPVVSAAAKPAAVAVPVPVLPVAKVAPPPLAATADIIVPPPPARSQAGAAVIQPARSEAAAMASEPMAQAPRVASAAPAPAIPAPIPGADRPRTLNPATPAIAPLPLPLPAPAATPGLPEISLPPARPPVAAAIAAVHPANVTGMQVTPAPVPAEMKTKPEAATARLAPAVPVLPKPASDRFPAMNVLRPAPPRQIAGMVAEPAAPAPAGPPKLVAVPPVVEKLPSAPETHAALDSLEEEMAKLLGRPKPASR